MCPIVRGSRSSEVWPIRSATNSAITERHAAYMTISGMEGGNRRDQRHPQAELLEVGGLVVVGLDDSPGERVHDSLSLLGLGEGASKPTEDPVEVAPDHVVLGVEVAEERPTADPSGASDVVERGLREAVTEEELKRDPRNLGSRRPWRSPATRGRGPLGVPRRVRINHCATASIENRHSVRLFSHRRRQRREESSPHDRNNDRESGRDKFPRGVSADDRDSRARASRRPLSWNLSSWSRTSRSTACAASTSPLT